MPHKFKGDKKPLTSCELNIQVTELVLTPITCASIINEILKYLIYQKSQIPYTYNCLKTVIDRRRNSNEQSDITNFTVERHYRVVSTAYDSLESISKNLHNEFKTHGDNINEVMILFGSNVYTPREVFKIRLNGVAVQHLENNHNNVKKQHKILRNIIFAEEWLRAMESTMPITNVYVMLKKRVKDCDDFEDEFFVPNEQYTVSTTVKNIVINLHHRSEPRQNCCSKMTIFEDVQEANTLNEMSEKDEKAQNSSESFMWFQAKVTIKGFKECFVNNVSASELW